MQYVNHVHVHQGTYTVGFFVNTLPVFQGQKPELGLILITEQVETLH